jgi:CDP-diacylglycerol---serine O-phosphatidyltransferase
MRKIYLLPNLFTTANIVFGFTSITLSAQGEVVRASWFIIAAAVCDLLDGRIARLTRTTSAFGVQYDSLSDLTSFGIAPAFLLHYLTYDLLKGSIFLIASAALFVVCAALRLARFNVSVDEPVKGRKGYFQGLPSPVAAGLVVSAVLFERKLDVFGIRFFPMVITVIGTTCALLMVSGIPFPSFKEVKWRSKGGIPLLLGSFLLLILALQEPEEIFFPVAGCYLVGSLVWSGLQAIGSARAKESRQTPQL